MKDNVLARKRLQALIIGIAIVLFWRGTWLIADVLIFPNDLLKSGIISVFIGLVILLFSRKLIEAMV